MAIFGNKMMVFEEVSALPLLLDAYPNAQMAYSLRQLKTSVTNVVRIERDSDNANLDFTENEITNGTLASWVGVGNGYIKIWYDQSGNGVNLLITGLINKIVSVGVLLIENGLPYVDYTGNDIISSYSQSVNAGLNSTLGSLFSVYNSNDIDAGMIFGTNNPIVFL